MDVTRNAPDAPLRFRNIANVCGGQARSPNIVVCVSALEGSFSQNFKARATNCDVLRKGS